jgi:hypothetical protein
LGLGGILGSKLMEKTENTFILKELSCMDKKIPDINKTPQPNPMNFVTPNQDYMPDESKSSSHPNTSSHSKKSWLMKLLMK